MVAVKKYLFEYGFILLWVFGGFIHQYVGAALAFFTFFLLLLRGEFLRVLIALWILFIFSDSFIGALKFAHLVKPVVMLMVGFFSLLYAFKLKVRNSFFMPFVLFFSYLLVQSFFSPVFLASFQKSLSYFFLYFSVPVLLFIIIRDKDPKELFINIILFGNLVLVVSIFLTIFFPSIGAFYLGRMNGVFRNPNGVGIFLVLYSLLSYTVFHTVDFFKKRTMQVTIALVLISLLLSGSRSAAGAILIFVIGSRMAKWSPWIFVVFTVVFYAFYQPLLDALLLAIVSFGYSDVFRLDTLEMASGRIYIWKAAWMEISENQFYFGGGFNYSDGVDWLKKYYLYIPDLIQHQGNIHQSYLTLWMNTGLVGIILFALGWLRNIIATLKKSTLILPIVASVGFSASYESWLIASMNPFTIQLIMIFAIILFYVQKENNELKHVSS